MSLIERIQEGKKLIVLGRSLGEDTTEIETEVKDLQLLIQTEVSRLKLSEFEDRHMALLVDSRVLGEHVWFCSDEDIAAQVRKDAPGVAAYTTDELREIIHLNPNPDELTAINNAKSVFRSSKILDSNLDTKNKEGK